MAVRSDHVPLGDTLRALATKRRQEQTTAGRERRAADDRARALRVKAAAEEFRDETVLDLPERLATAAERGLFDVEVWSGDVSDRSVEEVDGRRLGLDLISEWLTAQGIEPVLIDAGYQEIPDYGSMHTITLNARWA